VTADMNLLRHRLPTQSAGGAVRLVAATAVLLLAATACGSGSGGHGSTSSAGGKVTLTFAWWGDASRAKVTQDAVALFEKKHPNIKVETQYAPFGSYFTKLATQTAGGNAPDLMQIDRGYLSEYSQRGVLLDLSKYLGGNLDLSTWDKKFASTGKVDSKLTAVPFAQNSQTVVVDQTTLDKIGVPAPKTNWTWEDLKAWGEQVHAKSGGKVFGMADPGSTWPAFESWLVQHGKNVYTADGKINFTATDLESFWNFTSSMRKSGAVTTAPLTATITGTPADEPLPKGKSAAEWDYDSLFTMYSASTKDKLVLYPLPSYNGNTGMLPKPAQMLSVFAKTDHPKEAVELLDFMVNDPAAAKLLGVSRGMQPNLGVRKQMAATAAGPDKTVYDYEAANVANLNPTGPVPPKGDSQLLMLIQRSYQDVAFGRASVSAAAKSFMSQAAQIIGQ
jgi:multiple sugar transport system substrate-binding protein